MSAFSVPGGDAPSAPPSQRSPRRVSGVPETPTPALPAVDANAALLAPPGAGPPPPARGGGPPPPPNRRPPPPNAPAVVDAVPPPPVSVPGVPVPMASAPGMPDGAPESSSAPLGDELADWQKVYQDFLALKQQCGEPTASLTFDKFKGTLQRNKDALVQRHNCTRVKFTVYVKEGKAALKASPVK
jgi:hypothetical protein